MFTLLSSRRRAFYILSLLVVGASASAACTLDVSGVASSGAGGAPINCTPGAVSPCYDGPTATKDIGACKSGMHTCNADGTGFGACAAQVLPAMMDDCTAGKDESCDGKLTCPCSPNATKACYDGLPATTAGVGICKAGERTCNAEGTGFGDCVGEVKPAAEDCATQDDENCDGAKNEAMSGCVCDPTVAMTVACDANQPGECGKGTKLCAADGKGYGPCTPKTPSFEDCFTAADEDCDGMPAVACVGTTSLAGVTWMASEDDGVFSVASDAMGNIILGGVSGSYQDADYAVSTGSAELIKLDKNGNQIWKKSYPAPGGGNYSVVRGVTIDGMGNVLFIGEYRGTIDSEGVSVSSMQNSPDLFVVKLDAAGALKWGKTFGGGGDQFGASISAAANGDVFITGTMNSKMSFSPTIMLDTTGSSDVFVAKLDAMGEPVWAKNFGDANFQIGWDVAATPDGVAVTGQFDGNINFGGPDLASKGGRDIFLAKLDGNGDHVWSYSFGDGANQVGYGIAADSLGHIALTGTVEGKTNFGGVDLEVDVGKPSDLFVARFEPGGKHMWSKAFGDSSNNQAGRDVAVDAAGNVLVTGHFTGTLKFGNTDLVNPMGNNGTWDVFVAKLGAADGAPGWARRFGDTSTQMARAVTADPSGNVIFGGTFSGTIDFTPPVGLSFTSPNGFTYDAFWAKLAP